MGRRRRGMAVLPLVLGLAFAGAGEAAAQVECDLGWKVLQDLVLYPPGQPNVPAVTIVELSKWDTDSWLNSTGRVGDPGNAGRVATRSGLLRGCSVTVKLAIENWGAVRITKHRESPASYHGFTCVAEHNGQVRDGFRYNDCIHDGGDVRVLIGIHKSGI